MLLPGAQRIHETPRLDRIVLRKRTPHSFHAVHHGNNKIRERPPPNPVPAATSSHHAHPTYPFPNPCEQAGYYCPGEQNASPSLIATLLECGNSALFCPLGSVEPRTVGVGYYSVGGGSDGTTRDSQVRFREQQRIFRHARGGRGSGDFLYEDFCIPGIHAKS